MLSRPWRIPGHPSNAAFSNGIMVGVYSCLAAVLAFGMGQDLNWDLLNYHFYNPYMLVDGRLARDVHVAGVQSFLNPLMDLPFYAAVRLGVPPLVFFLSLAAIHGVVLFLVHRITVQLVPQTLSPGISMAAGAVGAMTAALGAGFLSEVGNTMHDNTLAVPILAALLIVLFESDRRAGARLSAVSIAGMLAGAAAGMKLAVGPLCLGLCASVAVLPGRLSTRTARVLVFSLSVSLGVILTGGFWMWIMHQNFGSPLFPFVNAFFRSPFAPVENFADLRMMPRDWTQVVFYPFMWMSTQSLVTEPPSRDSRFATVFMFIAIWAMAAALRKVAGERANYRVEAGRLLLVVTFWLVSYMVWLEIFSTYRYVIALEVLAAAIMFGVAAQVTTAWTSRFAIAVPICVALALSARSPEWGRTAWSDSYFGVDESLLVKYGDSTIVMWDFPQGYLPPLFPRSSTFVRIVSNWGLSQETAMWERAVAAIDRAPSGRLYLMGSVTGIPPDEPNPLLQQLGLTRTSETCATYPSHSTPFRVCALKRISERRTP